MVPYEKNSKFGFSISKKTAKSAVVRNRLRRTGYRMLKKYLPTIKTKILANFIFINTPKNSEEIEKNLESILKQSNLV